MSFQIQNTGNQKPKVILSEFDQALNQLDQRINDLILYLGETFFRMPEASKIVDDIQIVLNLKSEAELKMMEDNRQLKLINKFKELWESRGDKQPKLEAQYNEVRLLVQCSEIRDWINGKDRLACIKPEDLISFFKKFADQFSDDERVAIVNKLLFDFPNLARFIFQRLYEFKIKDNEIISIILNALEKRIDLLNVYTLVWGIKEPKVKLELFQILFNKGQFELLVINLESFEINDEKLLFDLAINLAKDPTKAHYVLNKWIYLENLSDSKKEEILRNIAEHSLEEIFKALWNNPNIISKQSLLMELAEKAVLNCPAALKTAICMTISSKFPLDYLRSLINKILLKEPGLIEDRLINVCQFSESPADQKELSTYLILLAKHSTWGVFEAIESIEKFDESMRIELAKLSIPLDCVRFLKEFHKFKIKDPKGLQEIFQLLLKQPDLRGKLPEIITLEWIKNNIKHDAAKKIFDMIGVQSNNPDDWIACFKLLQYSLGKVSVFPADVVQSEHSKSVKVAKIQLFFFGIVVCD